MELLPSWMNRDDPAYDPNRIGVISQVRIAMALVEAGKVVLSPMVQVRPYDFVIEDGGRFYRVQCKTGRLHSGAIFFRPHRLRAAKRETGWERKVTDYRGEVDFFGVYCPEVEKVYLVPIDILGSSRVCFLRLDQAKNGQLRKIRWAKDYEVRPLTTSKRSMIEVADKIEGP